MQLRSAVLCGFPDAVHDAGTSPQLQLHSAGIQLQPVLRRQIGFSKITYFGEGFYFFFFSSPKAIFIKKGEPWLLAWSCQVLNASGQALSTLNIVLFQHFLKNTQHPAGFNSVRLKCWQSRLQACCSHEETIRNGMVITSFLTTDFANSNQLKISKPNHWCFWTDFWGERRVDDRCCTNRRWRNGPPRLSPHRRPSSSLGNV